MHIFWTIKSIHYAAPTPNPHITVFIVSTIKIFLGCFLFLATIAEVWLITDDREETKHMGGIWRTSEGIHGSSSFRSGDMLKSHKIN